MTTETAVIKTSPRLAIFTENGRYHVYATSTIYGPGPDDNGTERRVRALQGIQPTTGYTTPDDAERAMADADGPAEADRVTAGSPLTPADAVNIGWISATGRPMLQQEKARPLGLPDRLADAYRRIADGVRRFEPSGAMRIIIDEDGATVHLLRRRGYPETFPAVEPAETAVHIAETEAGLRMTALIAETINEANRRPQGPRMPTLWNDPRLIVCGAPPAITNLMRPGIRIRVDRTERRSRTSPEPRAKMPNRRDTMKGIGEYVQALREGAKNATMHRAAIRAIIRNFHAMDDAKRREYCAGRPPITGTKWDAAAAAATEHAAYLHGYEAPGWSEEPERFVDDAKPATLGARTDVAGQPAAFLRRGFIGDGRDFDSRSGDGRRWTADGAETGPGVLGSRFRANEA